MKLAIMQPYFFPYIGYFQLIASADTFIIYDDIEYTKKGWINRNRILGHGKSSMFTIPLKKDSDFLAVKSREISPDFNRKKLLNQIKGAYARAPFYEEVFPLIQDIVTFEENNLFLYVENSVRQVSQYLNIETEISRSSDVNVPSEAKGQNKVLAYCAKMDADIYINSSGGVELYSKPDFEETGVELQFLESHFKPYQQFQEPYIPSLSIIDVLMFNSKSEVIDGIASGYSLF